MNISASGDPNWSSRAASLLWDGRSFIDGRRIDAEESLDVRSPIDGASLYDLALSRVEAVDRAVLSARRAFDAGGWSGISPQARGLALMHLADQIVRHHEELALRDTLEMGKPISAALADVGGGAPAICRYYAEAADKVYGEVAGSDAASLGFTLREPYGVVAAVAPWNYPLPNAVIKAVPALAAGNCVVLKPSELSSGSALRLAELAMEAGLPAGVFNVVAGDGPTTGAALVSHPLVNMVTFTGSTAAGRAIVSMASQSSLRPVMLECGGKSPQIVFEDAPEADELARRILGEALANQGQLCVARSRLLVHRSRRKELTAALERAVRDYAVGDPLDAATAFGPLAGRRQFERVSAYIDGAVRAGAHRIAGGEADRPCGVMPTIFDAVSQDMAIVQDEVFGPVLTLQGFDDVEEALDLANATRYGLATVWTAHYPTIRAMFRGLRTGHIAVNTSLQAAEGPGMALAGEPRGESGFGCETGLDGLRSYSTRKGVVISG